MREERPHRPALDAAGAEAELLREACEGRLCPEAVDAVLAAAGHRVPRRPRERVSAKTAGHHVQPIYEKAGVRSRAVATVWAFEHSLVRAG